MPAGAGSACFFFPSCIKTHLCVVSRRVELNKMKIMRPPAEVARYTMVFHKRDSGNEINKDRSVNAVSSLQDHYMYSPPI